MVLVLPPSRKAPGYSGFAQGDMPCEDDMIFVPKGPEPTHPAQKTAIGRFSLDCRHGAGPLLSLPIVSGNFL